MSVLGSWKARTFLGGFVVVPFLFLASHAAGGEAVPPDRPADLPAWFEQARNLVLQGKPGEAASLFGRVLEADAGYPGAATGRVRSLIASGEWKQALADAREHARLRPADAEAAAALSLALYRAGRLEEADRVATRAGAVDVAPTDALLVRALVLGAGGRADEAVPLLLRALERSPRDPALLHAAAAAAPSREATVELLERYVEVSTGDDPGRAEGARGTLRTLRALGDRPVWTVVTRPETTEAPMTEIPGKPGSPAGLVVTASGRKGEPLRLLLDTGASGLFLVERIARKHGFVPLATETLFGSKGEAVQDAGMGLLPELGIGGLVFKDALVAVSAGEIDPSGRYQGVLGLGVLDGYRVVLEPPRRRLLLDQGPSTDGVPFWTVEGHILVDGEDPSGEPALFLLDTGAAVSVVSESAGAAFVVRSAPERLRGYAGPAAARSLRGAQIRVPGLDLSGPVLHALDLSGRSRLCGTEIAGFVGWDLIGRSGLAFDTTRRKVSLARPREDRSRSGS